MAYQMKRYDGTSWVPAVKRYWDGTKWVGVDGAGDVVTTLTYAEEVLADSPLVYWRLGEASGTTAVDETGDHDATYENSPTLGAGGLITGADTAVNLDRGGASPQRVVKSHVAALSGFANITVEFWFQFDSLPPASGDGSSGVMLCSKHAGGTDGEFYVAYVKGGTLRLATINTSPARDDYDVSWTPSVDVPYHIVATYNGSDKHMYVNGTEVGVGGTHAGDLRSISSVDLMVGDYNQGADTAWQADGIFDEVAIYDTALSAARIQAHYDAATL